MKLKRLVQVMLITGSIVMLGACSSMHHRNANGDMSSGGGMGDGSNVQASGLNGGDEFGGQGNGGSAQGMQKRVYYFDFDRSDVHDEDKPAIFANADYLVAHPNSKIILEGHTDPRGSREYNVALGERRADSVYDMLKSKGVNPAQVRVVSYGAERLAAPGHNEEDFRLDRRAVIVYQHQ